MLDRGYKVINTYGGDEVVHVAAGVGPPADAEALKDGRAIWQWKDLRSENATLADALLQKTFRGALDAEGNRPMRRGFIRDEAAAAIETDLPPHFWWGDQD
jgi:hypothetical protein